jgi:hypothetical protein
MTGGHGKGNVTGPTSGGELPVSRAQPEDDCAR